MEKCHAVHRKARGIQHQENKALETLRNVLEHLDEAAFVEATYAQRDPNGRKNQSIDNLPTGTLFLGWSGAYRDWVFGLILAGAAERAGKLTRTTRPARFRRNRAQATALDPPDIGKLVSCGRL